MLDLRAENTMPLLEGSWEELSKTILLWLSVLTSIILKGITEILQVMQNLKVQKSVFIKYHKTQNVLLLLEVKYFTCECR